MFSMKLALAGDTMLGRGVADVIRGESPRSLVSRELAEALQEADIFVLNLECCISERGEPWPDPRKPFFFRAPPVAVELLLHLGVDCVTLANNHVLDYCEDALLDTLDHLHCAGIRTAGAGADLATARQPALLDAAGTRVAVFSLSDHPAEYAATADRPGIAFDPLGRAVAPPWLSSGVAEAKADVVVVSPHWGPNMVAQPIPHVRSAARALRDAGATLVAGHSAHVFHGVADGVLFDLGDFLDDYAVDRVLRNDLGLLFFVTLDAQGPSRIEAVPLRLEYAHTRLAGGDDAGWIVRRFQRACAELGTEVRVEGDRLVVEPRTAEARESVRTAR